MPHIGSLTHGFSNWDDNAYIQQQKRIQKPTVENLLSILDPHLTPQDPFPEYQPLRDLSLMFDFVVGQGRPFVFHFTNLLLHTANALLLYLLLFNMFGQRFSAMAAALLFATHPIHVESVAWVSSRKDLLGLFFFLCSALAFTDYMRQGKLGKYVAAVILYGLALFSKSQTVLLPLLLLMYVLVAEPKRWPWRRILTHAACFVAIGGLYVVWFLKLQFQSTSLQQYYSLGYDPNPIAILNSFGWYLKKLLWPIGLAPYYDLDMSIRQIGFSFFISSMLIALYVAAIVWLWRRKKPRPASRFMALSLVCFGLQLAPVLNFLPHPVWVADRYAYFASFFLFWPLCEALRLASERRAAAILLPVIVACAWMTCVQTGYWRDNIQLWQRAESISPRSIKVLMKLADAYHVQYRHAESREVYARAVQLFPDNCEAKVNLAVVQYETRDFTSAAGQLQTCIEQQPDSFVARYQFGKTLYALGRYEEAAAQYSAATQLQPDNVPALFNLALCYAKGRKFAAAEMLWEKVVQLDVGYLQAYVNLQQLAQQRGDRTATQRYTEKIRELCPGCPEAEPKKIR